MELNNNYLETSQFREASSSPDMYLSATAALCSASLRTQYEGLVERYVCTVISMLVFKAVHLEKLSLQTNDKFCRILLTRTRRREAVYRIESDRRYNACHKSVGNSTVSVVAKTSLRHEPTFRYQDYRCYP
jgi:hypothetical protein